MKGETANNESGNGILLGGDRLLRIKAVAEFLGLSEKTIRRCIDDGTLPSVKIRGLRLIRASNVNAMITKLEASRV